MKVIFAAVIAVGLVGGLVSHASGSTLYTDGAVNGTLGGYAIDSGYETSDSFVITGPSTVTGVDFGAWTTPGVDAKSVDWTISSDKLGGGSVYGQGKGNLTDTLLVSSNADSYRVDSDYFSTGPVDLNAGTYFLTLDGGSVSSGVIAWDANVGPSKAYESYSGVTSSVYSESFDILGTATAPSTPEPSGSIPIAIGICAIGVLVARRNPLRRGFAPI